MASINRSIDTTATKRNTGTSVVTGMTIRRPRRNLLVWKVRKLRKKLKKEKYLLLLHLLRQKDRGLRLRVVDRSRHGILHRRDRRSTILLLRAGDLLRESLRLLLADRRLQHGSGRSLRHKNEQNLRRASGPNHHQGRGQGHHGDRLLLQLRDVRLLLHVVDHQKLHIGANLRTAVDLQTIRVHDILVIVVRFSGSSMIGNGNAIDQARQETPGTANGMAANLAPR